MPHSPAERVAKSGATFLPIQLAAMAVGLQDHQRMLHDSAIRVKDSHATMLKAAGMSSVASDQASEDVGDIHIGDINYAPSTVKPPWQRQAPAAGTDAQGAAPDSPPAASAASPSLLKKLAIGAALLGTGAGGAIGANALLNPSTPAPAVVKPLTFDPNQYQFQIVGPGVTNVPPPSASTTGT